MYVRENNNENCRKYNNFIELETNQSVKIQLPYTCTYEKMIVNVSSAGENLCFETILAVNDIDCYCY